MTDNNFTRGSGLLEKFLAKQRAKLANQFISKSNREGTILDIGCGSYPYFLIHTNFKEKYGIDPSLNILSIKNINLKKLDITKQKLPFEDNLFDVITMLAVFEHIDFDKLESVLKDIRRVLKNNGLLVITTPAPWSDKLLHNMAKVRLISSEEIHEHKHNYNKNQIEKLLLGVGFQRKNVKSGYFEFGFNMWFTAKK
jgi:ubiquinone/menaquinone biosynthesis C-methylase UbiE